MAITDTEQEMKLDAAVRDIIGPLESHIRLFELQPHWNPPPLYPSRIKKGKGREIGKVGLRLLAIAKEHGMAPEDIKDVPLVDYSPICPVCQTDNAYGTMERIEGDNFKLTFPDCGHEQVKTFTLEEINKFEQIAGRGFSKQKEA